MTDQEMDQVDIALRNRNRWVLIGLAALFFVPVMVAIYLNSNLTDWKPGSLNVRGTLIEPVAPIVNADQISNGPWQDEHWSVLIDASKGCDDGCQVAMHSVNQVHHTLGRLTPKIQRVILVEADQLEGSTEGYERVTAEDLLDKSLAVEHQNAAVYLIDPFGNLMMRYDHGFDPTGLRKDLQRLLKHDFE